MQVLGVVVPWPRRAGVVRGAGRPALNMTCGKTSGLAHLEAEAARSTVSGPLQKRREAALEDSIWSYQDSSRKSGPRRLPSTQLSSQPRAHRSPSGSIRLLWRLQESRQLRPSQGHCCGTSQRMSRIFHPRHHWWSCLRGRRTVHGRKRGLLRLQFGLLVTWQSARQSPFGLLKVAFRQFSRWSLTRLKLRHPLPPKY